ncbi:MAG: AI-2E family transporter, partial [Gammaproteobacteria bacterium]
LDLALLIGMIAGLLSFVPYLGFFVGLLLASVAALVQFHDVLALVYVLIVFGIGQLIEGFILVPLLIGGRIGLHPVAVIFAVLAGGQLFGFFGVLLALPIAAVVRVLLGYAHERYVKSELYGPQPPEIARLD